MMHTPGPLDIKGSSSLSGNYAILDLDSGQIIGEAYSNAGFNEFPAKDNALLWAAAPDLLDACEAWMNWIKGSILSHEDIIKQTNAATTKARGQPPKKG